MVATGAELVAYKSGRKESFDCRRVSSVPCGKLGSTNWGVPELDSQNSRTRAVSFSFRDFGKKLRVRVLTL